uniref:Uncharacterized protein n=1 Tax=Anopheles farauti TaxID=69004 RepID=A0A182QXX7_9DIPT
MASTGRLNAASATLSIGCTGSSICQAQSVSVHHCKPTDRTNHSLNGHAIYVRRSVVENVRNVRHIEKTRHSVKKHRHRHGFSWDGIVDVLPGVIIIIIIGPPYGKSRAG